MYGKGMRSFQRRAGRLLRRTPACGFLPWARRPWTHRVAARAKLPTEVGDTVTGPQDQGKLHEDRAAEDVSCTQACLPRQVPSCSLGGYNLWFSKRPGGHAKSIVRNQQQSPY